MQPGIGSLLPHRLVAGGVLLIAALSFWQAREIPTGAVFAAVGPQVFPWIVTVMLAALGAGLLLAAFRGGWAHDQHGTLTELGSLGLVILGLLLNAALIDGIRFEGFEREGVRYLAFEMPKLGFILASTIMFVLVARGFESRKPIRDAAIGFVLAGLAYIGFDRVLGYKIGTGLIESLI